MALSPEEKETLDALTAKANTPDDDDFDIEIWDESGAGAKVPYRKGRTWLNRFGIDMPETPAADQETDKGKPAKVKTQDGNVTHATRYFGNSSSSRNKAS